MVYPHLVLHSITYILLHQHKLAASFLPVFSRFSFSPFLSLLLKVLQWSLISAEELQILFYVHLFYHIAMPVRVCVLHC